MFLEIFHLILIDYVGQSHGGLLDVGLYLPCSQVHITGAVQNNKVSILGWETCPANPVVTILSIAN